MRDYDRCVRDVWNRLNVLKDSEAWYRNSMLEAFAAGDGSIKDAAAFLEYGRCVGEVCGDVGACCDQ